MGDYNRTVKDMADIIRPLRSRVDALERAAARAGRDTYSLEQAPIDSPWVAASLLNSFTNTGGVYATAAYYTDTASRVFLRGSLQVPEAAESPTLMFVLEVGFRPVFQHEFVVVSGSSEGTPIWASVTVDTSGGVYFNGGGVESIPLDPVSFRTI